MITWLRTAEPFCRYAHRRRDKLGGEISEKMNTMALNKNRMITHRWEIMGREKSG